MERSVEKLLVSLNQYYTQNLTLNSDAAMYARPTQGSSNLYVKYHSETNIITDTVMKQSKGLNGNLEPENNIMKTVPRRADHRH